MIQPFTPADLESLDRIQPADWTPIRPQFELYLAKADCHPLKVELDGQLCAVANASVLGVSAWLSHVIVHPDCQGRGWGSSLVRHLLALLDGQAVTTCSLIATAAGLPIYRKQGFAEELQYVFLQPPASETTRPPIRLPGDRFIRPWHNAFTPDLLQLDALMSGERRQTILENHMNPEARIFVRDGRLEGFFLPRLGTGLVVALNPEAGLGLLKLLMPCRGKIVLPESNAAGIDWLVSQGYLETYRAWRMLRGPRLVWHPEWLFARIGGNFG